MEPFSLDIGSVTVSVALLAFEGRPTSADSAPLLPALLAGVLGGTDEAFAIAHDGNGAPFVLRHGRREPLFVSVSRTAGLAAACVAPVPVGIDVERIDPHAADPRLAGQFFSRAERAFLAGLAPGAAWAEAFFRIWTLKEAYIKARGLGFGIALRTFSVVTPEGKPALAPPADDPAAWALRSLALETGHVLGFAVREVWVS